MATTRNSAFKSSAPRLPQAGPSQYLPKLDPWFVGFAQLFREKVARPVDNPKPTGRSPSVAKGNRPRTIQSPPPAVLPGWPSTVSGMLALLTNAEDPKFAEAMKATQQGIPAELLGVDLDEVLPNIISLLKYQETIPDLRWREIRGDRNAGRQVVETADLYNRWMHGLLPDGGVRFKTNARHNLLMLYGLAGGLERLSSRELADFFDQFCPCGETHTVEVLRRLRRKLSKALDRGREAIEGIGAAFC